MCGSYLIGYVESSITDSVHMFLQVSCLDIGCFVI